MTDKPACRCNEDHGHPCQCGKASIPSDVVERVAEALETLFADIKKRIDNGVPCDGRLDLNGEYEMPWGNSTQFKLEEAVALLQPYRKEQK